MNQDELLKKYKGVLEADAKKYTIKSKENYNYWFYEGSFILLEAYNKNPFIASGEVIKALNIGLRNSYRKELEARKKR